MGRPPPRMQMGLALAVPEEPVVRPKMRVCTKCQKAQPESAFPKDASSPDGLERRCRECHRIRKGRAESNRNHVYANCHDCSVSNLRFCGTCKTHKARDQFQPRPDQKYGTHTRCIVCDNNRRRSRVERISSACAVCGATFLIPRTDSKKRKKLCGATECRKEYARRYAREKLMTGVYGITEDDYQRMLREQEGKCAICGTTDPRLALPTRSKSDRFCVDHDHATGRVRGLLCSPCNTGLGHFGDNTETMAAAVRYLLRNKGSQ